MLHLRSGGVSKANPFGAKAIAQNRHACSHCLPKDAEPEEREYAIDYFLYLWCGPDSPLFDKSKMATFERYFIAEKENA